MWAICSSKAGIKGSGDFNKSYSRAHSGAAFRNFDTTQDFSWELNGKPRDKGPLISEIEAISRWGWVVIGRKRLYPKGTLVWGDWRGQTNPYIIAIPCSSFSEAVDRVKNGEWNEEDGAPFTIGEWIERQKANGRWSKADEMQYASLYGTRWMDSGELPPTEGLWGAKVGDAYIGMNYQNETEAKAALSLHEGYSKSYFKVGEHKFIL